MPTIAIIDDRRDHRETVLRLVETFLPGDTWSVVACPPLADLQDYPAWLIEHGVATLLLDEKLQEEVEDDPVTYEGHDLIEYLRQRHPTLPIFVVTAYQTDPDLNARFGEVEGIISRDSLAERAEEYVARFVRAGSRFWEEHEQELAQLGNVASAIARGEATETQIDQARALQAKLGLSFRITEVQKRAEWLQELDGLLRRLEDFRREAEEHDQE